MVEHDAQREPDLPQREHYGAQSDDEHLGGSPRHGEQDLAEVEAQGGRGVKIPIDVMDRVEPPQTRDPMQQHVPPVKRIVHQHQSGQRGNDALQLEHAGNAPVTFFHQPGEWLNQRCLDQNRGQRAKCRQYEIPGVMWQNRFHPFAQRTPAFEPNQQYEGADHQWPGNPGSANPQREGFHRVEPDRNFR